MTFGTFSLNDGYQIPAIAYGTGSVMKRTDVTPYVEQALEAGFNHIDTASQYQTEEGVGAGIKESGLQRSELYITTKFGGRGEDVTEDVQLSLKNLGVNYVDLYLIHFPSFMRNDPEGTWRKMEKAKVDGFARSIGVSNFPVNILEKIMRIAKIPPAVNQIRLHPYNYEEMEPTIEYCKKHNIVLEAYSSLTPITSTPGGPVDAIIEKIGKTHNATPAQVLQLWVLSKDIVIVTTSTKKERLQDYLAVADLAPLTDEEIYAIEVAGAKGLPSSTALGSVVRRGDSMNSVIGIAALLMIMFYVFFRRRACN